MTKKSAGKTFVKDALIFAKVKGYPAWPARVQEVTQGKVPRYRVLFFGTYETANLKSEEMWPFNDDTKARFGKPQKKKGWPEAMHEIENNPYLRTKDEIDAGAVPLEGGTSGDTLLEDSSMDDSALDDSMKEEKEEAPLQQIEEKPKKQALKRKAESPATPLPAKQIKASTPQVNTPPPQTPLTSTPANGNSAEEKTSRSGRVLKPKKFEDENEANKAIQADEEKTPTNSSNKSGPSRKMWVEFKPTGDAIEIEVDKDKPMDFKSKEQEILWEKEAAMVALKYKDNVDHGRLIPKEILDRIKQKINKTPQDEQILANEKDLANQREKKRHLYVEHRLLEEEIALKMSCHYTNPELERCLKLADQIKEMAITPLMLKKHPDIVTTVRKMRNYVGPIEPTPGHEVSQEMIEKVSAKANELYQHFASLFDVPAGANFTKAFEEIVHKFREATQDMDKVTIMQLVEDPTSTV